MTDHQQEITRLMERIQGGSQEAVRELLERYGEPLLYVIRRRLAPSLRSQFDSQDLMQSVWASFFSGKLQEYHFDSPRDLIGFLVGLARNKVCNAARNHLLAKKRDQHRLRSLHGEAAREAEAVPAHQATPSQLALAEDQWHRLLLGQPEPHRRILLLLRQGHTHQEVARQLGINEKTVRRVVAQAADRLRPEARR